MIIDSSAWFASLNQSAPFPIGTGPEPYWPDVKGAPQNSILGGASLWALTGHSKKIDKGIAIFFKFLSQPNIQKQWAEATGYLPITKTAYHLMKQQGYYKKYPGAQVGIKELTHKPPTNNSKGLRIGNYMQIRQVNDEAIEATLSGKKTAQQAIKDAVKQNDRIINMFAKDVSVK